MELVSILALAIGVLLGFWIPGYLFSVLLDSPSKWISSFLTSLLVLFNGIFWLGILHIPLTYFRVMSYLVAVSLFAFILVNKKKLPVINRPGPVKIQNALFLIMAVTSGLLMLLRSAFSPLRGYDTFFRWNFLAEQLLLHHTFRFYPPLSPTDFKLYFYVDAIAPVVSFSYWWIYESFGAAAKSLTVLFVLPQYLLLLLGAYRITEKLDSARAGAWAVGGLIASPLLFWSVYMGQETGLTALSMAGTLFFILKAKEEHPDKGMILAGCAAAVGVLAREYGAAFVLCGVIVALACRHSFRSILIFCFTTALLSAPWYVRTWILTGNPVYSNQIGSLFPVNPVHAGLLQAFQELQGFGVSPGEKIFQICRLLLQYSAFHFTVGLLACILHIRRFSFLVYSSMILIFVWSYTAGIAAGGYFWSLRTLSPALLTLSVLAALMFKRLSKTAALERVFNTLILIACCQSLFYSALIPARPDQVPSDRWLAVAFQPDRTYESWARKMAPLLRPLQCRILSDDAYAHAGLYPYGVELVPVWSPEVRFVFDQTLAPESIRERLRAMGIKAVLYDSQGATSLYYSKFPFFSNDSRNWSLIASDGTSGVYLLPGS